MSNSEKLCPAKIFLEGTNTLAYFSEAPVAKRGKKKFFKHFSTKPSEHIAYKKASVLNYFLKLNSFFDIFLQILVSWLFDNFST